MAFCRLVFSLLVLSVIQSFASVQVPVFLWGDLAQKSLNSYPLAKITAEEYDDILHEELKGDPFTVIFIEETLSVEDFSRKNSDGDSSYPYLHANIGGALYLPSVENPVRVLNKLADPEKVDHVKLTENGLSAEIEPESGKFLFITLKDAKEGESRSDLLQRHNDFMEDMFSKLQEKYDKLVAIYTAHYPSWTVTETHSRVRRQSSSAGEDHSLSGLRIYYSKLTLEEGGNPTTLTGFTSDSTLNGTEMTTSLNFQSVALNLFFYSRGGYWFFDTVEFTKDGASENLVTAEPVFAPLGFSYRCAQTLKFQHPNTTKSVTVTFEDIKVQPFFVTNSTGLEYGDSYNCVGFFTAPIWAGLFVVFIMLSIIFYGLMMMMDIRTMDRFDDPKGKTITINAAE